MGTLYEEVRAALGESGFKPKKRLGQNFLIHERIIESILRLLEIALTDEILEIGPGLGFLTRRLVERAAKVWAVEVDPFLVDWMQRGSLGNHPKLELIEADILKVCLDEFLPFHKVKLVGNLPYSIATPALFRLFEWRERFSSMVLMVQKEVADRIASEPGVKAYGSLSVWSQVHGRITDKIPVSTEAFYPRPKVRSTVLKIELFSEPLIAAKEMFQLRRLVRSAFGQRRKTLANALTSRLKRNRAEIEGFLRAEGVDPSRRGETLRVEEFIHLARALPRYGLLIPER